MEKYTFFIENDRDGDRYGRRHQINAKRGNIAFSLPLLSPDELLELKNVIEDYLKKIEI